MVRLHLPGILALLLALTSNKAAMAQFPDAKNPPPDGWTGLVFKLSQQYPKDPPPAEQFPWLAFDFKTQSVDYLKAVLAYCLEGNTDDAVDWAMEKKAKGRMWYHAPWMHDGDSGREFIRGLTKERSSRGGELHSNQTAVVQNWAVSLYNPQGGFTTGQVWKDPNRPDASKAIFPEGTVSVKLLFSEATDAAGPKQVPFLKGAKVWQADIFRAAKADGSGVGDMRLLQIDVAGHN